MNSQWEQFKLKHAKKVYQIYISVCEIKSKISI
jgi:hypothetical protein